MAHSGWTPLHEAARRGEREEVRRLLGEGANPNARESGDNTTPLHWAAASGNLDIVRALLDAGADVHGLGDVHQLDVIGWATLFHEDAPPDEPVPAARRAVIDLLVERGARHHVYSAMAMDDNALLREVARRDPDALDRKMSRFERGMSPLHFALSRKRYDLLDLLIELGAKLEATNLSGQTPLETAMLLGDREGMERLRAAGGRLPIAQPPADFQSQTAELGRSFGKIIPMIQAPDVARAIEWYVAIGFVEGARFPELDRPNWCVLSLGKAQLMIVLEDGKKAHDTSLWFYTDRVDELYRLFRARQLAAARAMLEGKAGADPGIALVQDLEDMFYGARQFCIRDLNGYELYFIQPIASPTGTSPDSPHT